MTYQISFYFNGRQGSTHWICARVVKIPTIAYATMSGPAVKLFGGDCWIHTTGTVLTVNLSEPADGAQ